MEGEGGGDGEGDAEDGYGLGVGSMGILCGRWPWSAERWEAEKARRDDG